MQTKEVKYKPFIRPQDEPAIWINQQLMGEYRQKLKQFYFEPTKYKTYMEQLGIKYPTLRVVQ